MITGLGFNAGAVESSRQIFWPTPDQSFAEAKPLEAFIQPTASGRIESGLFGCTRNDGRRFHEGIDIKPAHRDRQGEATDPILAAMPGRVAYINTVAGHSGYGRYIVLEHSELDVPVYTLYAHLRSVEPGLREGQRVEAGQRIGVMGRSASFAIPRHLAHLHFEVGVRLTDQFATWFDQQRLGSPNHHGVWNGMNLIGTDPLAFYETVRDGQFTGMRDYLEGLPTAFTLRVLTTRVPDFVNRYPRLLTTPVPREGVVGWVIDFTWYGLPKRWTPLKAADLTEPGREGDIALLSYDPALLHGQCRPTVVLREGSEPELGRFLRVTLQKVFGF